MTSGYDYIVIGGGSGGAVAAARLVSEGGARVLLLEAGYSHRHPLLDMPPGIFKMINGSKYMRYHKTTPQPHLDGRVHDIPQGNVLGGGSSVNAQVYMRGRPGDYDAWNDVLRANNDNPGWGWSDVLPHFKGMEANNRLAGDLHGTDGDVMVSDPAMSTPCPAGSCSRFSRLASPTTRTSTARRSAVSAFTSSPTGTGAEVRRPMRSWNRCERRSETDDQASGGGGKDHRGERTGCRRFLHRSVGNAHRQCVGGNHPRSGGAGVAQDPDAVGDRARRIIWANSASRFTPTCPASART